MLRGHELSVLYEDLGEEESEMQIKKIYLIIFNMLKIFTKALENTKTDDLRNFMSYW